MGLKDSVIREARELTDEECKRIGIPTDNIGNPYCFVLEKGDILFPVSDRAMNSGGGWMGDTNKMESVEGEAIEQIAPMSDEYMQHLRWDNNVGEKSVVVKFTDGSSVYTASDPEGNGAGLLFQYSEGQTYEIVFQ